MRLKQALTFMLIRLELFLLRVRVQLDKKLKHIPLLRYMVRLGLAEQKQKRSTTKTSPKSTKASHFGIPDWLKRL